jgi:hypothetical protein
VDCTYLDTPASHPKGLLVAPRTLFSHSEDVVGLLPMRAEECNNCFTDVMVREQDRNVLWMNLAI